MFRPLEFGRPDFPFDGAALLNPRGVTPTLINLLCYWCWQLPLAYYLSAPLGLGVDGVYYAVIIAGATWALVGFLLFRRGKWKTRTI
jgi:Na+-driven multidrug efflux pump